LLTVNCALLIEDMLVAKYLSEKEGSESLSSQGATNPIFRCGKDDPAKDV